jgi:DnaK suppressor protein
MKETDLLRIKKRLRIRRREILEQVAHLESERTALDQRSIETIDEAQKEDLLRLLHKLIERGKEEIQEINLALEKMKSSNYGLCELCGKLIPFKRLKVLPATRLCHRCAQKYEENQKLRQHHRDEVIDEELLDAYRNLNHENSSIGRIKLPEDKSLLSIEEV